MGRDVAEQVEGMGREPGVTGRGFDGLVAEMPRLVEAAEQQAGSTQRLVHPGTTADEAARLALEELLDFAEPVQRLVATGSTTPASANPFARRMQESQTPQGRPSGRGS